ncbi:4Fe-4S binding protein [Leisingera aquaemixtae]|uniref:4Fe-4S binding protein n=1 Tax=Leisingera aquaemixtae TaxID=1396826 RepID=UPI0021A45DED|nr:4Fe-4S binding protein [Leisingera aquaemixtae]UWQ24328.1 4Fe-4S binding protein [Leisingera aquaemixtae]
MRVSWFILWLQAWLFAASVLAASPLPREQISALIMPPFSLGEPVNGKGVYTLLNSGGAEAGYAFETEPLAPLPGFSGAPVNVLVLLDLDGNFLDVRLISHNEPVFVSGLGPAPFHRFFEQYPGLSVFSAITVGTPYGETDSGSSLVYLDGVSKATASVRIAHDSVMAAALAVAREKMHGVIAAPPARPDPDHSEPLDWAALVDQGLATRATVSNAEVDAAFAGTLWADDDTEAQQHPEAPYLDLWIIDLGPPSIAQAALSRDGYDELQEFLEISPDDEPLLLIETGRHGLVSPEFIRNTAPDRVFATQNGLPVALRDSDLLVELSPDLPEPLHDGTAMILRADRRLGFDPAQAWTLHAQAMRAHGMFQPETGTVEFPVTHRTPERFFLRAEEPAPVPPWLEALRSRRTDLIVLGVLLTTLTAALLLAQSRIAARKTLTPLRLSVLAAVTLFIGWWGQGQLSIVTVLGVLRATAEGGSFAFLAYDPFSLLIWGFAILGLVLWGRALFCGWLCPFGALQEFAHHLGRGLGVPQTGLPPAWDGRLRYLKYGVLAGLVSLVFLAPEHVDTAAEVEPFKTAITTFFLREWYFTAYAVFWLAAGLVLFKPFCRYLCPLGAAMAAGGLLRRRNWIARRAACGSPCQLCRVKCAYGAIKPSGAVRYDECFGCLDCVSIHDDPSRCVPLILSARKKQQLEAAE